MNKSKLKGYRTCRAGREMLEQEGWIGRNLEKTGKFAKEKDLFGLWDFIFVRNREILFIQYKTNESFGKKKPRKWLAPYIEWGKEHASELVRYEVWNHTDRKGFSVYICR